MLALLISFDKGFAPFAIDGVLSRMPLPVLVGSLLTLAAASPTDARAIGTWLAQAAATAPAVEVVTSADVRQLVDLQGEKQATGCDDDSEACAAELAAALGAELLVRAELSDLEGQRALNVTVLSTKRLASTQRALWQSSTLTGLGDKVREGLPPLIAAARAGDTTVRIFVADVDAANVDAASNRDAPAPTEANTPWQVPVGGGLLGVGVVSLGVAAVCEVVVLGINGALDADGADRLSQQAATTELTARGQWATAGQVAWAVGGVAAVVGGGVLVVGLME